MQRSYMRGHPIQWAEEEEAWRYSDTMRLVHDEGIRPCKKCGKTFEGSFVGDADPCLGELPGVDNACCGHGIHEDSYIRFTNGVVVKGFEVEYTDVWKGDKPNAENATDHAE